MKRLFIRTTLIVISCSIVIIAYAQSHFTPYDNLPGVIKSHKPAYEENYPSWAKMLYSFSLNFNKINAEFESYMVQHPGEKSAIIRYYKDWRKAVADFVQDDGTILLPDMDRYYYNLSEQQMNAGKQGSGGAGEQGSMEAGKRGSREAGRQGSREAGKSFRLTGLSWARRKHSG